MRDRSEGQPQGTSEIYQTDVATATKSTEFARSSTALRVGEEESVFRYVSGKVSVHVDEDTAGFPFFAEGEGGGGIRFRKRLQKKKA